MRSLFCLLLLAVVGCDASEPEPAAPTQYAVEAVLEGDVVETRDVSAGTVLRLVGAAGITGVPFRGVPADSALEDRYRAARIAADVLSLATGDAYEPGHFLVRSETPGGPIILAPVSCDESANCLALNLGDTRIEGDPGAVFFPVLEDAERGPVLFLRPVSFGLGGRLFFQGATGSTSVPAQSLGGTTIVLDGPSDEIRVVRGTGPTDILVVVKRGTDANARLLQIDETSVEVEVPTGSDPVEVYVLEAE
ncbi:hypothetical protein [Rubrivirga sp.]|uniref:hypothetical protein n=1 Tax=Rubrivirga sp. TaxID=1885344 RepID=UPI003C76A41F